MYDFINNKKVNFNANQQCNLRLLRDVGEQGKSVSL